MKPWRIIHEHYRKSSPICKHGRFRISENLPDAGNITNAAVENQHDVCEDLSLGKGKLIALHLKETKPGIFREVPFLTGHVQFEKIINTAWSLGVRRYVTELWDVGKENWKEDICFANQSMRTLLDREA